MLRLRGGFRSIVRALSGGRLGGEFEVDEAFVRKHAKLSQEEMQLVKNFIAQGVVTSSDTKKKRKNTQNKGKGALSEEVSRKIRKKIICLCLRLCSVDFISHNMLLSSSLSSRTPTCKRSSTKSRRTPSRRRKTRASSKLS